MPFAGKTVGTIAQFGKASAADQKTLESAVSYLDYKMLL